MQAAAFEGLRMRSTKRLLFTALAVATATLIATYIAAVVLAALMPNKHDLSDISTGLIRLVLTGATGLAAGCAARLTMRALRRPKA